MKKTKLIIVVISGLIIATLVFCGGYNLGKEQSRMKTSVFNLLKLGTIKNLNVSGKITEISGRNLILTADDNQILSVLIRQDAKISGFILPELPEEINEQTRIIPEREEIKFEDIKIDDKVNILLELKPNGGIEGTSVVVLPVLPK